MQLVIETVKTAPSGKSLVIKASGKDYFAKTSSGLLPMAGKAIDAELKDSQFNGKTNTWIEKWTPVQTATPAAQGVGSSAGTGSAPATAWLPFASNTVAHAIMAGLVKEPAEVKLWAAAAKQAFTDLA